MAEFSLSINSEDLKKVLGAVKVVVDEAKVHVGEDGIRITAVDPTNVYLVHVELDKSDFDRYRIEEPTTIGVDIDRLYEFVKSASSLKKDATVKIEGNTEEITIEYDAVSYCCTVIDPSAIRQEPKVPDLSLSASVMIEPENFAKAIAMCDKISDIAKLQVKDSVFLITAEGDVDRISFSYSEPFVSVSGNSAESRFTLEYLKAISKHLSKFENLTIRLGDNLPVCLEAEPPMVVFYVAPRIEPE
jgi:proliferating cell nuclear antigen